MLTRLRRIAILKEAGVVVNPNENIDELVKKVVYYKDKKKGYWVDEQLGKNCFAIYPRGLEIARGDDPNCWRWSAVIDRDGIESAELIKTMWLRVGGSFRTTGYLCHKGRYKVSFWLKLSDNDTKGVKGVKGETVKLELTCPDRTTQESNAKLPEDHRLNELEVGKFTMTEQNAGEIRFSMSQSFLDWRRGLIIDRVEIKSIDHITTTDVYID